MKSIKGIITGLGLFALPIVLQAQLLVQSVEPEPSDSIVQVTAEAYGLHLVAPENLPLFASCWWTVCPGNNRPLPMPCPPVDLTVPIYEITPGILLVDTTGGAVSINSSKQAVTSSTVATAVEAQGNAIADLIEQVQQAQLEKEFAEFMGIELMSLESEGGMSGAMLMTYDPDGLWLEITNVSSGTVHALLHNGTNQVYAAWGKTNLMGEWRVETDIWPTNTEVMPFTVATLARQHLFLRAEDWTGKDSNADGVPDWWAWKYFGDLNVLGTNLDYSGSGLTFAEDYSNNITPSVFTFSSVQTSNNYVQSSSPTVQLDVAGSPYYIATLIDDSNFSNAVWNTYSGSSVTLNLGSTEGWHEVWIGLRGHGEEPTEAVWQWKRLKLDTTAPTLTITNPVTATVDQPVIQLQGLANEAVQSLSYDITNAAGMMTNQLVLITGQAYSTNTWEFTTNYFHAYDVPLTNGLNVIIFHARDRAGNVTMANFSYTLDYTGKTAPEVQLLWPTDKLEIVGSNIVCRGWASDDTATVTVQLVDANGLTNSVGSLVGRDGIFYADNLTLAAGTNYLSYTVTDAATNTTTTNIMVLTSDLDLTMDPVVAGQSLVTGTIGDTNYTICVNGVRATIGENLTWSAEITPIGIGGGAVVVNAVLGGGDPSIQQIVQSPEGVFVSHYHKFDKPLNGAYMNIANVNWEDGRGGRQVNIWLEGVNIVDTYLWPATAWPQPLPWCNFWDEFDPRLGLLVTNTPPPIYPELAMEFRNIVTTNMVRRTADTEMKLATGGPPGSRKMNLWCISASATDANTGLPIAFTNIAIGGLGNLDENGSLYVLLPDNDPDDVTPKVKKNDNYSFTAPSSGRIILQSLTVVSNAVQVGGTNNWAAVKATNEYVYVKATLSTDDTNAANQIQWSIGDPVPHDPFQRKISKAASAKIPVTATLGSTNKTVNVWILWSTISFQMSGSNPANAPSFDDSAYPGDTLGIQYYAGDDTNSYLTTITNCEIASGKICIIATLSPVGIHTLITNGWDMIQMLRCHDFVDGVSGQGNPDVFYYDDWTGDGPQETFKKIVPDFDDKLYSIDGPSVAGVGRDSTEIYNNFYEYVTWNSKICSDTNYFWHFQARWKNNQVPAPTFTDLGGGLITLPVNAHYPIPQQ